MDPQALTRVGHKMQELQVAAQTGQPYTLNLDEAELNAWLHANLALSQGRSAQPVSGLMATTNAPVDDPRFQETQGAMKDLRVNLVGDNVRTYAVFRLYGQEVSLLLEGQVRPAWTYARVGCSSRFGNGRSARAWHLPPQWSRRFCQERKLTEARSSAYF